MPEHMTKLNPQYILLIDQTQSRQISSAESDVICSNHLARAAFQNNSQFNFSLSCCQTLASLRLFIDCVSFHRNQCVRVTLQGGWGLAGYFQCLLPAHQGITFHSQDEFIRIPQLYKKDKVIFEKHKFCLNRHLTSDTSCFWKNVIKTIHLGWLCC